MLTNTWPEFLRDRAFFFIVGAAKAGTTSLHAYLDAHVDVHMSEPKETHFFTRAIVPTDRIDSWAGYADAFRGSDHASLLGDASPSYLWDPSSARAIHEALPDSRIIVLVRDPVARAISHYVMDLRLGLQHRSFQDALLADAYVRERAWNTASHLYVDLGLYADQVRRYLDLFGPDRVLVLESTTLLHERDASLGSVAEFLGLDPTGYDATLLVEEHNAMAMPRSVRLNYVANRPPIRRVGRIAPARLRAAVRRSLISSSRLQPHVSRETRLRLQDIYAPDIEALRAMTGMPLPSLTANWV